MLQSKTLTTTPWRGSPRKLVSKENNYGIILISRIKLYQNFNDLFTEEKKRKPSQLFKADPSTYGYSVGKRLDVPSTKNYLEFFFFSNAVRLMMNHVLKYGLQLKKIWPAAKKNKKKQLPMLGLDIGLLH